MKVENQVTSLEISKQLKELGVEQESLWYYRKLNEKYIQFGNVNQHSFINWHIVSYKCFDKYREDLNEQYIFCSAFTVAELGLLLPVCFFSKKYNEMMGLVWTKADNDAHSVYYRGLTFTEHIIANNKTEANARGKMLAHLLDKKLIDLTDQRSE